MDVAEVFWLIRIIINEPTTPALKGIKNMSDGKKYCYLHTVKHNAFKAGLDSETVYTRLRRGWQFSEIFLPIQKRGRKHKYFYHGMPIKEYCKEIGLRYGTFIMRIKRGYSIRQALGK